MILGSVPPYEYAGFHAQQAAEKALKALLVRHQVGFAKTHDIGGLLALAETIAAGVQERLYGARALSPYAVDVRYPSEDPLPPLTRQEAVDLVSMAALVVDHVHELLGGSGGKAGRNG